MRVRVYWNTLMRNFSVLSWEGESKGRVIDHAFALILKDCKFVVQPHGKIQSFVEGTIHNEYTSMKGYSIKTADYVFLTTREEAPEIYASKEES